MLFWNNSLYINNNSLCKYYTSQYSRTTNVNSSNNGWFYTNINVYQSNVKFCIITMYAYSNNSDNNDSFYISEVNPMKISATGYAWWIGRCHDQSFILIDFTNKCGIAFHGTGNSYKNINRILFDYNKFYVHISHPGNSNDTIYTTMNVIYVT